MVRPLASPGTTGQGSVRPVPDWPRGIKEEFRNWALNYLPQGPWRRGWPSCGGPGEGRLALQALGRK